MTQIKNSLASGSIVHRQVLNANADYVKNFGSKGELALPPARQFAILTRMDARLDPARYAGLEVSGTGKLPFISRWNSEQSHTPASCL